MDAVLAIARRLARDVDRLAFAAPVAHVYNPLVYARELHEAYLRRYAGLGARILLLGMNPGPFGMVQTGVPFGSVEAVRGFLRLDGAVARPAGEHPARPVLGLDCPRQEVSGQRLWGWARRRFGSADRFFASFFVWNCCPLAFLEASGRNRTPDALRAAEQAPLFAACDEALDALVVALGVERVIGVGAFAEARARQALAGRGLPVGRLLHPSPASPAANRGWEAQAEAQLLAQGVELP